MMPTGGRLAGAPPRPLPTTGFPPGPAVTAPWPNPCGSDSTPNGFNAVSEYGTLASLRPPPFFTHAPRMSGVPSGSRLIAVVFAGALSVFAAALGAAVDD